MLLILLAIGSAWIFRSVILKKILIETVTDRSNGDLDLSLNKIEYNPFYKKIKIFDLSLIVSLSDTLDTKKTRLRSVSFDSLIVSDFDLWKILSERKIKAGEIITAKPDIVFYRDQKQSKTHTTIGNHFNSVQTNDVKLNIFPIEIGILKVEYGNVLFEADSTNNYLGSADFWIELHEFNTSVDSLEFDSHSFLYSRRLIIDISNFSKPLKNGKDLNIDNLKFDSKTDRLEVSNFNISSGNTDLNNSLDSVFLKNIEIDGLSISEIKMVKELKLRAIRVSDGYISVKPYNRRRQKTKINQELLKILFQFIKDVEIDTLSLAKINCDIIGHSNNRIVSAEGIDFELLGFSVDTSMYYSNLLSDFDYFDFALESLIYDSIQQFEIHNIAYTSKETSLKMSDVLFKDDSEKVDFKSVDVLIDGLDINRILNRKPIKLDLNLTNPEIKINLSSKYFKEDQKKNKSNFSNLFNLEQVTVNNAHISLFNDKGLNSEIYGLDVSFGVFPKSNDSSTEINIKNLRWVSRDVSFSLDDKNIQFSTYSTSYENGNLNFSNGRIKIQDAENKHKLINTTFFNLFISEIDIIESINSKELKANQVILLKPTVDLDISLNKSLKSSKQSDSLYFELPLGISVANFLVKEANLYLNLEQENKKLSIASGIDLSIKEIDIAGEFGMNQIQQLDIDLQLWNTQFENESIISSFNSLKFITSDSSINISNITLKLDSVVLQNSIIYSNSIEIEIINLSQFDYLGILRSEDISFNKLKIVKPYLDLYSYTEKQNKDLAITKSPIYSFNENSLKEIEIENFKLEYSIFLNGLEKKLKFGDFDFIWTPDLSNNSNLLSELLLDIKDFEFLDTEKQTKIEIGRVFTSKSKNDLEIIDVILNKQVSNEQNGLFLRLPLLSLKNITHNNNQAYKIEIEELSSDTLILEFNNRDHKQLRFTGRVEALEKYSDLVNRFNIRKSSFHNVDISINNISDTIHEQFLLDELDIFISDVGFRSSDSAMLHLRKIKLDLKGRKLITADSLYEISSGEIFYDFANNSIRIDSFKLKPRYGMDEFYKRSVFQTTMLDITGNRIVLSGIDFHRAITKKEYLISTIDLDGFKLTAHRDKNYPFKHGVIKPFPSELLRGLNTKFYVDTVKVNNSSILFGLFVEGSDKPGEVFFDDVNIRMRELSNMPSLMTYPPVIKLDFESKIMGSSRVTAKVAFPLNTNGFSYSGKTEEIDFRDFNSMTQNLFGISITKGKGNIDILGINAGDSLATGSIKYRYKKLRVGLYDRDKAELDKGIAAPFFSFLVNDLLIKSNNPRFFGRTRTGLVYIEPNREKSFINYIWKGLLSGIMSTMWHNSKEQRKEKRRINDLNN